ncbi:MAG TPA: GxxExxY protein [Bryobacteraceae bacterium]|nr:GxxExxY protein [Bryobacteraceae bacterium]
MNADESNKLSEKVIGGIFAVSNTLGCGFLEKVYERALVTELRLRGLRVDTQVEFQVLYRGEWAGTYVADLIVGGELVVELKCVERFSPEHVAQCLNYLRVSGKEVCLLVNFGHPKVEWRRILKPKSVLPVDVS